MFQLIVLSRSFTIGGNRTEGFVTKSKKRRSKKTLNNK